MGLSAERRKQKIGNDPRNLTWSENAARFGHAYLSKLGWTATSGLGAELDGRTKHVAVAQKLNMLGIGANTKDGPDAIAWKQNQEFEAMLSRLNKGKSRDTTDSPGETSQQERDDSEPAELEVEVSTSTSEKEQKCRRKEEKRQRKEERARRKAARNEPAANSSDMTTGVEGNSGADPTAASSSSIPALPSSSKPHRMAHRARYRAAKNMAGANAVAMAEILGESSAAATPTPSSVPSATLTPIYDVDVTEQSRHHHLITSSTTSMTDYFKQKMQAKLGIVSASLATQTTQDEDASDEASERPGIASGSRGLGWAPPSSTITASQEAPPIGSANDENDGEIPPSRDGKRKKKGRPRADDDGEDGKDRKKRRQD
ncbi:hypothetical protein FRB93_008885 [Tulasnella sp. JGI-2019a]|nr:hypothetical protein FRB93_008885 [Tulasnella sp. JGI-2019a]